MFYWSFISLIHFWPPQCLTLATPLTGLKQLPMHFPRRFPDGSLSVNSTQLLEVIRFE